MMQKQLALQVINALSDDAPLSEIVERVEFLAAIQKGLDQLDHGEGIPHEEVKRQLASWLARCQSHSTFLENHDETRISSVSPVKK